MSRSREGGPPPRPGGGAKSYLRQKEIFMWGYVESIRDRMVHIEMREGGGDRVDYVGYLDVGLYHFEYGEPPIRGLRADDYLDFSPTRGFSRLTGRIIYDLDGDVPERYRRCALCNRTLRGKKYWSLYFGKASGDAYHKKCLKQVESKNEAGTSESA